MRCIWIDAATSDACAVEAAPELRTGPHAPVRFDDIMEALRSLDKRLIERLGGTQEFVEIKVHTTSLRHNLLPKSPLRIHAQAALPLPFVPSCWVGLLMAMLRGFSLSGIRRTRLIWSSPFSNAPPSTSM